MRFEARLRWSAIASTVVLACLAAPVARAAEAVTLGTVGQPSANLWPELIALDKGFFASEDLKVDLVYIQSSAALVQQVTAGSPGIGIQTGLADPLRAAAMGAPISVVRINVQAPPYDLVAKPGIASLKELKGKVISLGGPKDITRIYVERMLKPNGVNPGEFDMVFAGATSARAQALLSNAVDAAIILPPFNFQAVAQGFNELGLTVDYAPELPFSGTVVNLPWAKAHQDVMARVLAAHAKATAWFEDDKNRAEAVRIMVEASKLKPDEVEKSYDFFRKGKYFEPTGRISRKRMDALVDALVSLGDIPKLPLERLILPGVTQTTD